MKIRIQIPSHLGVYKLSIPARRVSAKKLIEKHLKLFSRMNQKVTEIILVVDDKEYSVKPKSEEKKLIAHAESLIDK